MSEDSDKLPLSLTFRDLLGYVAPGGVFFGAIWIYETLATRPWLSTIPPATRPAQASPIPISAAPFHDLVRLLGLPEERQNWLSGSIAGLALLLALYIAGHIIASASSTLIERVLVFKGYGYPYETQLNLSEELGVEATRWRATSRSFYRATFFWANLYAVVRYCFLATAPDVALFFGIVSARTLENAVHLALMLLLVLLLISKLALGAAHSAAGHRELDLLSETEKLRTARTPEDISTIQSRIAHIRARKDPRDKGLMKYVEYFVLKAAIGYNFLGDRIAGVMGTRRVFGPEFRNIYGKCFQRVFGMTASESSTNNFWMCYAHVMERSKALARKLQDWQTQYTFARNLATAFYMAFLYCWLWLRFHPGITPHTIQDQRWALTLLPLAYYALGAAMLLRYYYLYRGYFTKFVFRAFVYLCASEPHH